MKAYLVTKAIQYITTEDRGGKIYIPPGTLYVHEAKIRIERYGTIHGERVDFKKIDYWELSDVKEMGGRDKSNPSFREIEVSDDLVKKAIDAKQALDDAPKNLTSAARELSLSVTRLSSK